MDEVETARFEPVAAAAPPVVPVRRGRWGWLVLFLVAFLLGIVAMGWTVRHWPAAARTLAPAAAAPAVVVPAQRIVTVPLPIPAESPAGVEALADRIDEVEARTRDAVGDAERAEGLLITFAARRAIERGVALGYLEGPIRQHFAAVDPRAVATVLGGARQPVTLADLREGLAAAEPRLVAGAPTGSTWGTVRRELANLVVLRRAGTSSATPVDRFARATEALAAGEVDAALAEVARMPGRDGAAAWIGQARRYLAVRAALDRLETAALIAPVQAGGTNG